MKWEWPRYLFSHAIWILVNIHSVLTFWNGFIAGSFQVWFICYIFMHNKSYGIGAVYKHPVKSQELDIEKACHSKAKG